MSALTWRRTSSSSMPSGCLALFFLIFLLAGAAVLWFLFVRPALKVLKAQAWPAIDCSVIESQVEESSDSDGTTYRAKVVTAYSFNGEEHRSGSYDFSGSVYSSGYAGKAEIVSRYPVGTQTTCYVDPENPSEAVISRDFRATYLFGLFGLLFFLPGLFGMIWALRGGIKAKQEYVKVDPSMPFGVTNPQGQDAAGPIELKAKATPVGKFLGLLVTAVIWNGIVGTIGWFAVLAKPAEEREGCLMAFLAIFALIGLFLIYATIRQFLVLFSPRPKLTLSPGSLGLGETAYLQWRLSGATGGVRRLCVTLEGQEEARYRRGTDTHTDRETFALLTLVDSTDPYQMVGGSTSFALPADTMPSFTAENNRIVWTMKAQLEIANWPDSEEEFEILVRP